MSATLHKLLGKICHIYLDFISIGSNTNEQHTEHSCMVLTALHRAKLYCNLKKHHFYLLELDFLGHHISAWESKPTHPKLTRFCNGLFHRIPLMSSHFSGSYITYHFSY